MHCLPANRRAIAFPWESLKIGLTATDRENSGQNGPQCAACAMNAKRVEGVVVAELPLTLATIQ